MPQLPLLSGVILAGGRGARWQGQDKGWLPYGGGHLIEHQLDWLAPQVDEILISANRHILDYQALGPQVLVDSMPGFLGPLAGILSALQQMQHDWLLVASCDSPELPEDLAQQLWAQHQGRPIAYARAAGQDHFLAALISVSCMPSLQDYLQAGQRKVGDWYRQQQAQAVDFVQAAAFLNLNSESDLRG